MNNLKELIKKLTGHEVKFIFSYNLSKGGFVDYGTGDKAYSIKFDDVVV